MSIDHDCEQLIAEAMADFKRERIDEIYRSVMIPKQIWMPPPKAPEPHFDFVKAGINAGFQSDRRTVAYSAATMCPGADETKLAPSMLGSLPIFVNDFAIPTKRIQWRFPRSKKRRIQNKWCRDPANWIEIPITTYSVGGTIIIHSAMFEYFKEFGSSDQMKQKHFEQWCIKRARKQ